MHLHPHVLLQQPVTGRETSSVGIDRVSNHKLVGAVLKVQSYYLQLSEEGGTVLEPLTAKATHSE